MSGPHPSTALVRLVVRRVLAECAPGDLVLVACSGGGDSMALAEAACFEGPRGGLRVGAVVIDHGLQPGSGEQAAAAVTALRGLGADPVVAAPVVVEPAGGGLEAAARTARYAALDAAAERHGARLVLLGHTLDDQAEQVLLGLARGSGARSLSGMPPARGRYRRPLLGVTRAQCREALVAEGHPWWDDPMNDDPAYARVRARRAVADLEHDLGPGIAAALARSADQLRADADALDALADAQVARLVGVLAPGPLEVDVAALAGLARAVRGRVWRRLLVGAGVPAGRLAARHVDACDRLVTQWNGQRLDLPGRVLVSRSGPRIAITPRALVE